MAERKLTIRMQAETANLKKGMATASVSTRGFGKSIEQGITRHAAGIRMTGMAIAGIGAALTGMAVVSIKAAASLETSLANVSTMLDKTAMDIMPEYERGLREMSKEFGEATETLSKGLYDILSASIDSSKALNVLEVSAKLAAAGLTDTGTAADAITTIINSYAMAAEDAGKISDWMFSVVKRGKLTMAELAPSVGKVAATASIAGVSLEELGASIATITRAGIRSQEAMTAINGILRAFLKPTDDAVKAAKEFGFELNTNTLRTIGFRGVIELLSEATAEQTAAMFPNIRGLKGVAAAMKDTAGFTKDYELMLNSAGMTEEAFVKQTGTLNFALGQLKQEFADILVSLGKELIPIIKRDFIPLLKSVGDKLKAVTKWFANLSPSTKKFLLVLGPVLIALGGLITLLPSLIPMLHALRAAFHAALGPVGLIIIAISAAVAAFIYFYTTSEKFRDVVNNIGRWFKALGLSIGAWVKWFVTNFVAILKTAWSAVSNIFKNGVENIAIFFLWLGENIANWGKWFGINFLNVWKNLFSAISTSVLEFGSNIIKQIGWIWEKIKHPFKKIPRPDWTPLFEDFKAEWAELPKFTELKMKSMAEGIKIYWEPMPGWIEPSTKAVEDLGKAADSTEKILDKMGKTLGGITERLIDYHRSITGIYRRVGDTIKETAKRWVEYHRTIAMLSKKEETAFTKHMNAMRKAFIEMAGHAEKTIIKLTMGNAKRWVEYHRTIATLSKKEETGFTKRMDAMRKAHISMTESVEKDAIQLIAGTGKRWVAYHRAIGKLAKESYATYHESLERAERERIALLDSLTKEEKEYYREIKGYLGDYTDMTKSELEEVKNAWGKAGEDINTGWTAFMISMRDTTINWVEEFKRLSGEITEVFKSSISSWIRGGQTFGEFWSSLTQKLADTWLNNFIDNLMKTEPIKMVLDSVTWLMGNLTKAIMGAASAAWEFAGPAIMKLISGLGSLIGKLWDAVAATMKFVYATLKAIAVAVYNAVAWIPFVGPVLGIIAAVAAIAAILALLGSIIFPAQKGLYAKEPMTVRVAEEGVPEIISPEPIMRKIVREESQIEPDRARYAAGIIVNVPRGAIVIYGDIRTKMDVEELEETLGQKFGEEIARRVEEV